MDALDAHPPRRRVKNAMEMVCFDENRVFFMMLLLCRRRLDWLRSMLIRKGHCVLCYGRNRAGLGCEQKYDAKKY